MTDSEEYQSGSRPIGTIQPVSEQAARALAAVEKKRPADAEKCLSRPTGGDLTARAWRLLVQGLAAIETGRLAEADPPLLQAASLALVVGLGGDGAVDADGLRLTARALHHLGWVYRRQDRPADAQLAHRAAYHLRDRYGSYEELWETAVEIGLDLSVAGRFDEASRWYRLALSAAEASGEPTAYRQAVALTHLSRSLTETETHDEAVAAARTARDRWREHDMGAITAAQSDLRLGTALLQSGRALHERKDPRSRSVLREAMEWLATARDALLAFGPIGAADAQSCREQIEFARRLCEPSA